MRFYLIMYCITNGCHFPPAKWFVWTKLPFVTLSKTPCTVRVKLLYPNTSHDGNICVHFKPSCCLFGVRQTVSDFLTSDITIQLLPPQRAMQARPRKLGTCSLSRHFAKLFLALYLASILNYRNTRENSRIQSQLYMLLHPVSFYPPNRQRCIPGWNRKLIETNTGHFPAQRTVSMYPPNCLERKY